MKNSMYHFSYFI